MLILLSRLAVYYVVRREIQRASDGARGNLRGLRCADGARPQ